MAHGPRTPDPGPLIIGHRGFAARYPDNSLAGVEAGFEAGADGVEVDVRACADGVWVCHHDRARGGRPVGEWGLEELRRAGVPTLAEVVAATPRRRWLYVEVKPAPARELAAGLPALAALLAPRAEWTRVISSSEAALAAVAEALPSAPRSLVFDALPAAFPAGVELSPFHRLVERLAGSGRPLHPWTVNRRGRLLELARAGVASITSDDPARAVEVLRG